MNDGIPANDLQKFEAHLSEEERSRATIEKYLRDIRTFLSRLKGKQPTRERVLTYKAELLRRYAVTSANSMLAALNAFFRFLGRFDLCVKQYKIQHSPFSAEDRELSREEYVRLVTAAKEAGNERLSLLLQAICGTGIRVSELQYITVEALKKGEAVVSCKGKNRRIFFVSALRKRLLRYARERKIKSGAVFITRSGKPISRNSVWREMKRLCRRANVKSSKVFPHNLRHLFARTFYALEKDIAKLADILGHTSINTTRIYISTTASEHRRRMENMHLIL